MEKDLDPDDVPEGVVLRPQAPVSDPGSVRHDGQLATPPVLERDPGPELRRDQTVGIREIAPTQAVLHELLDGRADRRSRRPIDLHRPRGDVQIGRLVREPLRRGGRWPGKEQEDGERRAQRGQNEPGASETPPAPRGGEKSRANLCNHYESVATA